MSFKRFALILGLLLGGVGFAEGFDATVATPGVLKLKVTVLDRETQEPLPYVKMGFNFNNGTVRIVRAIDMRTGADGVATREVPYDSAGNIVLDGAAYAHQHPEISWANKSFNLVASIGQTIDIDPVDAAGWNWNTDPYNGEYRVRRVVPGEGQYMRILGQTSHDNATLANVFSVQTGATLHFKCWLQRPDTLGAHTVTYETSLVSNAGDFAQETVADGGTTTRTAATPVNAIWATSAFTGWTVDGVPFDPASPVRFNLALVPHWEGTEGEAFTLDTSRPVAGEEMTAVPAEGLGTGGTFVYRWTRGNTGRAYEANPVSTTASYTPTQADYEHWFKFEMSLQLNGRNYPLGSKEFFFSKLPVLYMTTNDGGDPTPSKEDHDGHLVVQGGRDFDTALDIDFSIHVRGNSSTQYPKLPYKIKLDKKKEMFGIPENKHWILVSNYLDPSLVRDKIAYDFAAMIGSKPAVRSTWVDCVLNGRWIGCYLFCEHLRVGKDRVDVYDWEGAAEDCAKALLKAYPALSEALEGDQGPLEDQMKQDFNWVTSGTVNYAGRDWAINTTVWKKYSQNITGGYFFELSEEFDSISKWRVDLGGDFKLKMMVNAPEYLASNTAMMDYCKDYWNQYWNAVRSPNGYSGGKHWKELCKLNSMVTYWLTMEIFGNDDSRQKSRFAYKDVGEKLYFGPVWDFDWGMGGAPLRSGPDGHLTPFEPTGWKVTKGGVQWADDQGDRAFYREWIDDPLFCTRAYEKYHEFRAAMMDIVAEGGVLSQHAAYLAEAGGTNSVKWLYKGQTFSQDVADLRVYLANRFAWLDKQFASVGTLMTSLRDAIGSHSASPYVPDSATLPVAFLETRGALGSPETSVLHVWHEKEEDLEVSFKIGAGASQVASVETYVNGLIVGEGVPVTAGQTLNVTIPHDMMDAKPEQRDVVQFVARNANGGVVARNFALVSPMGEVPDDPIARYCWDLVPGTLKVAMKVMNKAGTEPLKNVAMQLCMTTSRDVRQAVAVGTTDDQGYLFIELPYDAAGNIIQNGVASTTFNLTDVRKIDCDPVLSSAYSWAPLTPGLVRNFPVGYSQYVNSAPTGQGWDDAVMNTADSNGDQTPDYIAAGASLYFECYLSDNTAQGTFHTVTFDTAEMTPESAAAYASAQVAHNGTYTFPHTAPVSSAGGVFQGWKMTVQGTSLPGATTDLAEGTESLTVAQNLTLTPIFAAVPPDDPIARYCGELVPGTFKVAMKVTNKAGTEPLKNVAMQLCMTTSRDVRQAVAVGTTDDRGYLFIELPYDAAGNIIQNGVTSETFNLTDVKTIDCDPVLSSAYSWAPLTPGLVRNFPVGYSQYVNSAPTGQGWDNAVMNTADSNGDQTPDYIAAGASLYFECYLTDNTAQGTLHTVTFDTEGMTPESAAAYASAQVAHNGTYTFPHTAPVSSTGGVFQGWKMTVQGTSLPGATTDLAEGTESFTVAQNLTLTPIWGGDPNVQGIIRFRVHLWDHAGYWSHGGDVSAGRTMTPVNGLTFVLKSYPGDLQGGVPDSQKVPVGRPNTAEGWEQSRVEAKYLGLDGNGQEMWEATYVISNDQLQYLTPGHVIDTDPDVHDLATVNRGFGEEEVTFDWDWYYVGDDHVGAGLTGVREIPEGHSGNVMIGRNANNVAVITQEMIANGFEFTFNCWVVPALVVKFDTDNGSPSTYAEQRCPPINSTGSIESQQFYAQNPGSPTRGADESFVGWYEVSTDEDGNPVLASEPWNFSTAVGHSMTLKAVYRQQLGVALMIVDHDDADAENVYLAFKPQFATGVDQQAQQTWLTGIVNGTQDVWVKTAPQRAGVGAATPVKAVASTKHTSTIEKVWVKVPLSSTNEAGGFSQIVLDGEPIAYTCADGTTIEATGSQGATSVNTFGYLRVATNTVNTMVSVPWTWYSDKGTPALPADKLVRTTNLSEGDQLYAYAGASNYLAWVVNANKQWEAIDTLTVGDDQVGSNAKLVPNGNTTTLPHGTGVWLVRQDPTKPFWLYGQSVTNEVTTTITPMGEGETARSTMLGNPYAQAMCISNLVFTGTVEEMKNDTIVIPNGTGSPMYLEYRNKGTKREPSTENGWVWVSLDTSVSPPKNKYNWDVTIPPGSAFWYVRRNAASLSVTWKLPKAQEPSGE